MIVLRNVIKCCEITTYLRFKSSDPRIMSTAGHHDRASPLRERSQASNSRPSNHSNRTESPDKTRHRRGRRDTQQTKDLARDLDEAVATDDEFLRMVREDRTRLASELRDWCAEYSLDIQHIEAMAERLLQGDLRHLYDDLPPHQRDDMETAVRHMRSMSMEELMVSIAKWTDKTDP
ncbi:hypothetical protein BaRGS_00026232 [Batillaria attramentaria]|uniref:Uncharacterized protein n=1 Tax=Batillaria attramentaria TaxID=370345 RepID=A0ABD0K6Q7_9CAEN